MNDELDKMTDAELDAAVARNVLGWESDPEHEELYWVTNNTGGYRSKDGFAPSTDISDAWLVRCRLEELNFISEDRITWMGWGDKNKHPFGYSVWFSYWPEKTEPDCGCPRTFHAHVSDHKQAPRAICLAALRAVAGNGGGR